MRPLSIYRPANILLWPDYVNSVALTTVGQAFDIPDGAGFVEFRSTAAFTAKFGSTGAAIATTSSTAGNAGIVFPAGEPALYALGSTSDTTGFSILAAVTGGIVSVGYYGKGGG